MNSKDILSTEILSTSIGQWSWTLGESNPVFDPAFSNSLIDTGLTKPKCMDAGEYLHPADKERLENVILRHVRSKGKIHLHLKIRFIQPTGSIKWFECIGSVIKDQEPEGALVCKGFVFLLSATRHQFNDAFGTALAYASTTYVLLGFEGPNSIEPFSIQASTISVINQTRHKTTTDELRQMIPDVFERHPKFLELSHKSAFSQNEVLVIGDITCHKRVKRISAHPMQGRQVLILFQDITEHKAESSKLQEQNHVLKQELKEVKNKLALENYELQDTIKTVQKQVDFIMANFGWQMDVLARNNLKELARNISGLSDNSEQ
jgi:regulator of replication initiation timing